MEWMGYVYWGSGRALEGGQATLGPPLQLLPYQERNGQSRQLFDMGFSSAAYKNDAARRAATVFEKWNCVIETDLPKRRGRAANKRLNPYGGLGGGFAAVVRASTRGWAGNSRPAPTKNAIANLDN